MYSINGGIFKITSRIENTPYSPFTSVNDQFQILDHWYW